MTFGLVSWLNCLLILSLFDCFDFFFFFAYFCFFFFFFLLLWLNFARKLDGNSGGHVLFYKQMAGIIVVYSHEDPADPAWSFRWKKQIEKREQREGEGKEEWWERGSCWAPEILWFSIFMTLGNSTSLEGGLYLTVMILMKRPQQRIKSSFQD